MRFLILGNLTLIATLMSNFKTQGAETVHLNTLNGSFTSTIGIDYHVPSDNLAVSVNWDTGTPINFELISREGTHSELTFIGGLGGEIKLATPKSNQNGFSTEDVFAGFNNAIFRVRRLPKVVPNSLVIVSESITPANGVIDSGETVTLNVALANEGPLDTANLTVQLLAGPGVNTPSGSQSYGVLGAGGPAVSRQFTFTASGSEGTLVKLAFREQDGPDQLGSAVFWIRLGGENSTLGAPQYFTSDLSAVLLDQIWLSPLGIANPYPSSISVAGAAGSIAQVCAAMLDVNKPKTSDLDVLLKGPTGSAVLMSDAGGGFTFSPFTITLRDDAAELLPQTSTIVNGSSYRPTDYEAGDSWATPAPAPPYGTSLAGFNGSSPNGTWSLFVTDDSVVGFEVTSSMSAWGLTIFPPGDGTGQLHRYFGYFKNWRPPVSNPSPWVLLSGEGGRVNGFHIDESGVFSGDLIVVSTSGKIWRLKSDGTGSQLPFAQVSAQHLEGVTVVPNNPSKYGAMAGKIITGNEQTGTIYLISSSGQVTSFNVGINPEDFDIIPPNQNFFGASTAPISVYTAPATDFANMVGDILVAQETPVGKLFRLRWDFTLNAPVSEAINGSERGWEHICFAPLTIDSAGNDAPTLTSIKTFCGPAHDTSFTITHAMLLAAANEWDAEGDPISFRIESVTSGSLTKNGVPVTAGSTLIGPGEYVVWTPPAGQAGNLEAFRVVASDGTSVSSPPVPVVITVNGAASAWYVRTCGTPRGEFDVPSVPSGNWKTRYGGQGYVVVNNATSLPSFASVTPIGNYASTWAPSSQDGRALQKAAAGNDRVAACWHSWQTSEFTIDVNLQDTSVHEVTLYCVDWDYLGREQRIEVLDAATGKILDVRTLSNFYSGRYLTWNVWGHVQFRVSQIGWANCVVSGLFIDPSGGQRADIIWVEDEIPGNGFPVSNGDTWTFIQSTLPQPNAGQMHVSGLASGEHQHYFIGSLTPILVNPGDELYTWIFLKPTEMPREIMLQWFDGVTWEHRAYWGENLIGGSAGTGRTYMGSKPQPSNPSGQWFRLSVPAWKVGLGGRTVDGMAFTLYDGSAAWDKAGKLALPDSDCDGLPDAWEQQYFSNLSPIAADDPDGDGLANIEEVRVGSNPTLQNTDGDGLLDADEVRLYGSSPANSNTDGDEITDYDEVVFYATDPSNWDGDGDLYSDYEESAVYFTDPNDPSFSP